MKNASSRSRTNSRLSLDRGSDKASQNSLNTPRLKVRTERKGARVDTGLYQTAKSLGNAENTDLTGRAVIVEQNALGVLNLVFVARLGTGARLQVIDNEYLNESLHRDFLT
jgi:hypothetical protein